MNVLPEIEVRLKPRQQQEPIHVMRVKPGKIGWDNKGGKDKKEPKDKKDKKEPKEYSNQSHLTRESFIVQNSTPLHRYVRISFSNKTVVYKKRVFCQDKGEQGERENLTPQCHQSDKIVIMKQSPKVATEPSCSELKGCKSLLNTKVREKKLILDRSLLDLAKKRSFLKEQHRSLMDISIDQFPGRYPSSSE